MIALQYRLHELYDDRMRRALIDQMIDHYAADPDLVAFLRAVDNAVGAPSEEAQEDIKRLEEDYDYLQDKLADLEEEARKLRAELSDAQDELNSVEVTFDELRADLEYWKGRAAHD